MCSLSSYRCNTTAPILVLARWYAAVVTQWSFNEAAHNTKTALQDRSFGWYLRDMPDHGYLTGYIKEFIGEDVEKEATEDSSEERMQKK